MRCAPPRTVRVTGALSCALLACLLVACGTSSARLTPAPAIAHGTATPSALFGIPTPPLNTGPVPGGVASGMPPVTYTMPAGFYLTLATDQEVKLATAQGVEQILFAVDPSQEDTSHPIATMTVGGERGYVLQRGDDGSGLYSEVIVVSHHSSQYELSCIGFHGYDRSRIEHGCATFTGSLAFVS